MIEPFDPNRPWTLTPPALEPSPDEAALEHSIKLLAGSSSSSIATSTMVHASMRVGTATVNGAGSTRLAALKSLLSEVVKLNTPQSRPTRGER